MPEAGAKAMQHGGSRGALFAACLAGAVVLCSALVLISLGLAPTTAGVDAKDFHIPAVERFAREWPTPNLRDYLSATTPGYHLLTAAWSMLKPGDHRWMALVSAAVSACVVGLLSWLVVGLVSSPGRRRAALWAVWLALPLVVSSYFLGRAVTVTPDNAGILAVAVVLALAWCEPRAVGRAWWLAAAAAAATAVVLFRQNHVWVLGVLWTAGWLGREPMPPAAARPARSTPWADLPRLLEGLPTRCGGLARALLASAPALGFLGWFIWIWGGLAPPTFQEGEQSFTHVHTITPATPPFMLALVGIYTAVLTPLLVPAARRWSASAWGWVLAGAALGLVIGLIPPTLHGQSNNGGLWQIAKALPTIAGRSSVLIVGLSCVGGAGVAAWAASLTFRERWLFLAGIAGFIAAMTPNSHAWQKYYEPTLLILLAIAAAKVFFQDGGPAAAETGRGRGHWLDAPARFIETRRGLTVSGCALLLAAVVGVPPMLNGTWRPLAELPQTSTAPALLATERPGPGAVEP